MTNRVLQQAEQHFRAGRRQAAIDLLEQHMLVRPEDRHAASVLGKIYLRLKQPMKAAHWLRLALRIDRQVVPELGQSDEAESQLDADELDYIVASTGNQPEWKFDYEYGFDEGRSGTNISVESDAAQCQPAPGGGIESRPMGNSVTEETGESGEAMDVDEQVEVTGLSPATDDLGEPEEEREQLLFDDHDIDVYEFDVSEAAGEADCDWEDFALEDSHLAPLDQEAIQEIPDRLTNLRKAHQVAGRLGYEADWEMHQLPALIEILAYHRCHGKTQSAMRTLMLEMKVTPHELSVMHEVRLQWGMSGYSRTFRGNEACDGWPKVSWQLSLRMLRLLQMDSADEILLFVEDCFQNWNDSPRMLSAYPIFSGYLDYVIGHMAQVSETCGQRVPPFIDYDLFPDDEFHYDSWRLDETEFLFGYSIFYHGELW